MQNKSFFVVYIICVTYINQIIYVLGLHCLRISEKFTMPWIPGTCYII